MNVWLWLKGQCMMKQLCSVRCGQGFWRLYSTDCKSHTKQSLTSPLGRIFCSSSLKAVPILRLTVGGSSPGSRGYSFGSFPVSSWNTTHYVTLLIQLFWCVYECVKLKFLSRSTPLRAANPGLTLCNMIFRHPKALFWIKVCCFLRLKKIIISHV